MYTKKQLNQIRKMGSELKRLKQEYLELAEVAQSYIMTDCVFSSKAEEPYNKRPMTIRGIVDTEGYIKARAELQIKGDEIVHCETVLQAAEQWMDTVDDITTRAVFKLRFLKNKSWQQIAFKIGSYDESTPRKMVDRYLEKN
ncbi:MAG: hypothetical protein HFE39_07240 [Clostridiales bacterium]|nr:hypothetical protein [Clostridiales bacterium]